MSPQIQGPTTLGLKQQNQETNINNCDFLLKGPNSKAQMEMQLAIKLCINNQNGKHQEKHYVYNQNEFGDSLNMSFQIQLAIQLSLNKPIWENVNKSCDVIIKLN